MDIKNNSSEESKEEEFIFSETKRKPTFSTFATSEKKTGIEKIKRKHFVTLLMVLLIAVGGYQFWLHISPILKKHEMENRALNNTLPEILNKNTPLNSKAGILSQPAELYPSQNDQKKIIALTTQLDVAQATIEQLNSTVADLQSNLSIMDNKLDYLNQAVQQLSAINQSKIISEKTQKKKLLSPKKISSKIVYYVHAIIPGRAWLSTINGKSITVSVGDEVPGYGTVQTINVAQGLITTNTNTVIGFNPNDS